MPTGTEPTPEEIVAAAAAQAAASQAESTLSQAEVQQMRELLQSQKSTNQQKDDEIARLRAELAQKDGAPLGGAPIAHSIAEVAAAVQKATTSGVPIAKGKLVGPKEEDDDATPLEMLAADQNVLHTAVPIFDHAKTRVPEDFIIFMSAWNTLLPVSFFSPDALAINAERDWKLTGSHATDKVEKDKNFIRFGYKCDLVLDQTNWTIGFTQ